MSRATRIEITERARADIVAASAWWSENRPAARDAFIDELDQAFQLLLLEPAMGTLAGSTRLPGVRRVTLSRIRYYVYYRLANDTLQILAVWHTSRGRGAGLA